MSIRSSQPNYQNGRRSFAGSISPSMCSLVIQGGTCYCYTTGQNCKAYRVGDCFQDRVTSKHLKCFYCSKKNPKRVHILQQTNLKRVHKWSTVNIQKQFFDKNIFPLLIPQTLSQVETKNGYNLVTCLYLIKLSICIIRPFKSCLKS